MTKKKEIQLFLDNITNLSNKINYCCNFIFEKIDYNSSVIISVKNYWKILNKKNINYNLKIFLEKLDNWENEIKKICNKFGNYNKIKAIWNEKKQKIILITN